MAEPVKRSGEIRRVRNLLAGRDVDADIRNNVCMSCHGPAVRFRDARSRKDYTITGLCQTCQDRIYRDPEL